MGDHMVTESEEDDPVVKEIPIINSKRLGETLHLFQYPLKRKNCMNEHNIKRCFFKPNNQEIKLELGINVNSPNFDRGKAEIIAQEVDGETDSSKDKHFENDLVDRVFLESDKLVSDPYNYAAAVYNGKEIHLTALKGIFQFRPSFRYMDNGLKKKKGEDIDDDDEEQAGPSSAQQVTVKFKSNDERAAKNENSYKSLKAKRDEEAWIQCSWHERNSVLSSVERLKLISDNTDDTRQARNLTNPEYLKLLIPPSKEEDLMPVPILEQQCHRLMKRAQILPFREILGKLRTGDVTADVLLKTLPNVAVLVRGNWVVKSKVLYPTDTHSATNGVPAELMCKARDYILYLFTKNQYVERKKIIEILKIHTDEIEEIFTGVSELRRQIKKWELKCPTDEEFISKHSDLVQKQNLQWEHRFHQLSEFLN